MKLYHGTTEAVARIALKEGLRPRGYDGRDSVWVDCPSNEHAVYLTDAYAVYFALAAVGDTEGRAAIIEVDTDLMEDYLFVPDEDALEQGTRTHPDFTPEKMDGAKTMQERTKWFRDNIEAFEDWWERSVEVMGNCAYMGEIPAEAITRIVVFDRSKPMPMIAAALDPTITILNYRICGAKYRALTRWFAGYDIEPDEVDSSLEWITASEGEAAAEERRERWGAVLADRSHMEVLHLETLA